MNIKRESKAIRRYTRLACGLLLGAVLLGLLLWITGPREVLRSLREISPIAPLLTLSVLLVSIPLRTLQWQWLMARSAGEGFSNTMRAVCLGYAANLLFPLRGGELLKALYCSRKNQLPFERVLTALVLCRFQDLFPIFLLTVLAGTAFAGPLAARLTTYSATDVAHYRHALAMMGIALTLVVAGLALAYPLRHRAPRWICAALAYPAPRAAHWLEERFRQIAQALEVLAQPRYFWGAQTLSFLCWALFTLATLPILRAAGLDWAHAGFCALAINGLATLIQLLPAAPGDIGTYHTACVAALQLAAPGLPLPKTLAIAVLLHAVGIVGPALPGFFLWPYLSNRSTTSATAEEVHPAGE